MILKLKPGHDRLTNQQPLTTPPTLLIRQQERTLILPTVHDPLHPLPLQDILPDHERLDPRVVRPPSALRQTLVPAITARTAGRGDFVRVDDDVAAAAAVQGMHCPALVAVEVAQRSPRREQVVDGGHGIAGVDEDGGRVLRAGGVGVGVRDPEGVAVSFHEVAPLRMWLEVQLLD